MFVHKKNETLTSLVERGERKRGGIRGEWEEGNGKRGVGRGKRGYGSGVVRGRTPVEFNFFLLLDI